MEYETLLTKIKAVVDEAVRDNQPELEGISYFLVEQGVQVATIDQGDYPSVVSIHTMGLYPKGSRPANGNDSSGESVKCPVCGSGLCIKVY